MDTELHGILRSAIVGYPCDTGKLQVYNTVGIYRTTATLLNPQFSGYSPRVSEEVLLDESILSTSDLLSLDLEQVRECVVVDQEITMSKLRIHYALLSEQFPGKHGLQAVLDKPYAEQVTVSTTEDLLQITKRNSCIVYEFKDT